MNYFTKVKNHALRFGLAKPKFVFCKVGGLLQCTVFYDTYSVLGFGTTCSTSLQSACCNLYYSKLVPKLYIMEHV